MLYFNKKYLIIRRYCFLLLLLLDFVVGSNQKYGDHQIAVLIKEHLSNSKSLAYLGQSLYKNNEKRVFQVEVESSEKKLQENLFYCFRIMTKIGTYANVSFDKLVIIIHVEKYDLPIIANSKFQCSKIFFIDKTISEKKWRSECLVINIL